MANFEVARKLKSEKQLSFQDIKSAIKSSLGKNLKYTVIAETENTLTVSGAEKGAPYKFEATFQIEVDGNKAKVSVDGNHKVTGLFTFGLVFCVLFCWMLLPLIGLVIGLVRLNTNKNMYSKKMDEVLSNVDTQLAW